MLSKTGDTNPRLIATGHDAAGSLCTGIIDAASTSESRKMLPLSAFGNSSHAGRRSGTQINNATQTAAPMKGKRSEISMYWALTTTGTTIAATRINATMNTRAQSTTMPTGGSRVIGE